MRRDAEGRIVYDAPGLYPRWEERPEGQTTLISPNTLVIDKVTDDNAVESLELTRDDAFLLGLFLSVTFRNKL